MRSGCAADAQRARSVTTAVVEAKKAGVPMTPPQNRPKILLTPHHLHLREFLREIGAKSRKLPQFHPSSFLRRND
jgi:hypothetical protein